MKKANHFLIRYLAYAPLSLAFERVMECRILDKKKFVRPVLDIGCGEGLFAKILFDERVDVGIDPNEKELERARELGGYVRLIQCRGDAIDFPDNSFNTIFSNSVIEHIENIEPVFSEVYRLLSIGGAFFVTVPSEKFHQNTIIYQFLKKFKLNNLRDRYVYSYNKFWAHYHFYDKQKWCSIAENAGFSVKEVREYGPLRVCLLNDLLVLTSVPEWITKKLFNRWTLFPWLRCVLLFPFLIIGLIFLCGSDKAESGGLVFLELRK